MAILTERLAAAGHVRSGLRESDANALILLITSFSAYLELRRNAGLSAEEVVSMLREVAEQNILEPEA